MNISLGDVVITNKDKFVEEYDHGEKIEYTIRKGEEGAICDIQDLGVYIEFEETKNHPHAVVDYLYGEFEIKDK